MEKFKVSLIVPIYKAEKTIVRCVKSILNQTYKNIELILVDDGSPDNSGYICDQYKLDSRVIVIHDKNHGVSHARNNGLQKATGDYITFCDSDDYYSSNHIEKMLKVALDKNSDITISGYYIEKNNRKFISSINLESGYVSKYELVKHFTLDNEFGGFCWNKLYKKDLLRNIKFPEDIDILEDTYFLCLTMKKAKAIYYIAQPLYYYCNNPNSAVRDIANLYSNHNTIKYVDSWKKILERIRLDKDSKELINIAIFEMSVDFKANIMKNNIDRRMILKELDKNIHKFKILFLRHSGISLKHKIKIILKIILLNTTEDIFKLRIYSKR